MNGKKKKEGKTEKEGKKRKKRKNIVVCCEKTSNQKPLSQLQTQKTAPQGKIYAVVVVVVVVVSLGGFASDFSYACNAALCIERYVEIKTLYP